MSLDHIPRTVREKYRFEEWRHAIAILTVDFPNEWKDSCRVLGIFHPEKERHSYSWGRPLSNSHCNRRISGNCAVGRSEGLKLFKWWMENPVPCQRTRLTT